MKNINILFTFLFLTITSGVMAQEKAQSYIGVAVGPSFAIGDFSKAEAGTFNNWNNKAGFAKTGFSCRC